MSSSRPLVGRHRYLVRHEQVGDFNYASRLALAYLLSVTAAVAILIPLGGEALTGAQNYFTQRNIVVSAVLVAIGTIVVAVGGALNIAPTLRWFIPGLDPTIVSEKR